MIQEKDLYFLLKRIIPDIQKELIHAGDTNCPYKIAAFFAVFTRKLIRSGNLNEVRNCFGLAENLLENGNYTVRNAMENVYIYSVTQSLAFDHSFNFEFPCLFKKVYQKQLSAAGI